MIRTLRLTACVAALLLAGGTAWAQSLAVAPLPPPFLPPPPGFIPCMPGTSCMGPMAGSLCVCSPSAAACGTGNRTASNTVAELMRLYRMLYRQGKQEEAAAVARQVEQLNPVVGQMAFLLAARSCCEAACSVTPKCCGAACGEHCACSGACCAAAKDCACGAGCKCCKGDTSACACGKACKCQKPAKPAKPTAGAACHGTLIFGFGACLPGMPCPLPVPMLAPPCRSCPTMPAATACGPNCPNLPCCVPSGCCPVMSLVGPLPMPAACCGTTACACKPAKPAQAAACSAGCGGATCEAHHEERAPVCITAVGGRVHITTPAVEAECDRVTPAGQEGRVQLEGHVSVQFRTADRAAAIETEELSLGLQDGSYEINSSSDASRPAKCKHPAGCGEEAAQPAADSDHAEGADNEAATSSPRSN